MRKQRDGQMKIVIDLTQYPDVMKAIQEAASQMDWSAATLLRRNLVAAYAAGVDFKNAFSNLAKVGIQ